MVKQKKQTNPFIIAGAFAISIILIMSLITYWEYDNNRSEKTYQTQNTENTLTTQQKAYVDFIFTPKMISTNYNTIILITDNQTIILKRTQ